MAPDKFKGTLTGLEAARAIGDGIRDVLPDAEITVLPIADGGEGTIDAVVAAGGRCHNAVVTGPLGEPVDARWASTGDRAVLELASASGLAHVAAPSPDTALDAHTTGLGELLRAALDAGYRKVYVGLGGSASTDGGAGALTALGARLLDVNHETVPAGGRSLSDIASIDVSGLDPRLGSCAVTVCCDVEVPLLGPAGAAAVFGPQKGADEATVRVLDAGLAAFARQMKESTGRDAAEIGWGGAAGGTAAGLFAGVGARFASGFGQIAELLGLDTYLGATDLVVIGEGRLDEQSLAGKAPIGLAERARKVGVPVVAVVGALELPRSELLSRGIGSVRSAVESAGSAHEAQRAPAQYVRAAAATAMRDHLSRTPV